MIAREIPRVIDCADGYAAAVGGEPWDVWQTSEWQIGWWSALLDQKCQPWQGEHFAAPWIDHWNRLDAFAYDGPRIGAREGIRKPFLYQVPNGEQWSVATCGKVLVAYRRPVKWIGPAAPKAVSLDGVWPMIAAIDKARDWLPLSEVQLPAPELEMCADFWTCGSAEADAAFMVDGVGDPRPMTYEEAVAEYGEDAEDAWAPWEKHVRFPICGRDVAVPFLRKLRAYLPGARVACDVNPGDMAPLSGDFMGGLGRWLLMPVRRQ